MQGLLLISIGLPVVAGILLLALAFTEHLRAVGGIEKMLDVKDGDVAEGTANGNTAEKVVNTGNGNAPKETADAEKKVGVNGKKFYYYVGIMLVLSVFLTAITAWTGDNSVVLFRFIDTIPVYLHVDDVGRFFITIVSVIWLAVGLYSVPYMKHEGGEKRYYGFLLLSYGVLTGLIFAGNLITMYLFYELITLVSMPLVLHNGTREAVMAARKYLFYSLCGAYGGLFGIFFLYRYCGSLDFMIGGTLDAAAVRGHEGILLIAVFVMLMGFGVKAGMLPLHAWLPAAHSVAPSPASAVLSAVIVKAGVIAIVRVVFYIIGADFLRGTWVQYIWMILALLTIFMGSMLAYREREFKKRLAYSTVSQVSYILYGLSLLTFEAMEGAFFHVAAHGLIKCGLFLTAGVFLYRFGYTRVEQLEGLGKKMPKVMWCYTLFSLGLIGIPPTCGFISKWYLAQGSLKSEIPVFSWLGPVILLVSALLTAGYLLPITIKGFFPGEEKRCEDSVVHSSESVCQGKEVASGMLVPLIVLAALVLMLGIFPTFVLK